MTAIAAAVLSAPHQTVFGGAAPRRKVDGDRPPANATNTAATPAMAPGTAAGTADTPVLLRVEPDRPVDIRHISLDVRVDLKARRLAGTATIDLVAQLPRQPVRSVILDAVDMTVSEVALVWSEGPADAPLAEGRRKLEFVNDGRQLTIALPAPGLARGQSARLRITYAVVNPRAGLYFFGPTPEEPDVPLQAWTQGEPTTNRHWLPCVDHPGQRQTTALRVTVDDGLDVLSNGRLAGRTVNADGSVTHDWRQDQPHVSYLVTMVVGRFAITRQTWRGRPVTFWVPPSRAQDALRTFGRTCEMLDYFSDRFGIEYPWDQYAQVVVEQFTAGGMENTSATTLTDRCLHDARAALDSDAEGLIAHELGHQWWGDLVTCRDWAHLWLNEGFASYSEVLWTEHSRGQQAAEVAMLAKARAALAGGKTRPVVDRYWPDPGSMFDARAYPKGAWVLHMLRHELGEDLFWQGLRDWGTQYRLQSAETADFRRVMERVGGRSLERFFYDWTQRPGAPVLEVTSRWVAERSVTVVEVRQTQPGEAFVFPLRIECVTAAWPQGEMAGAATAVEVIAMDGRQAQIEIPTPRRPLLVRVDPQQAVLAEIREVKPPDQWLAQLTGDPAAVQRIRAARHLGRTANGASPMVQALSEALGRETLWEVASEIAAALGEAGGSASRQALLKHLAHSHPKVRRAVIAALAGYADHPEVVVALRAKIAAGDASVFVEAEAARVYGRSHSADTAGVLGPLLDKPSHNEVIRAAALGGLAETGEFEIVFPILVDWLKPGRPRLARMAALSAIETLVTRSGGDPAQTARAARAVLPQLDGETRRMAVAAVTVLGRLGRAAAPVARARLEALAANEPDDRLRQAAVTALETLDTASPAASEWRDLRREIQRLRQAQDSLLDRLEKLDKSPMP